MFRFSTLLGLGLVAIALLVGVGTSGEGKKDKDKIKGQLPQGWKNLNLGKDQVLKIYTIQTDYRSKINDLEEKIKDLKAKERTEMVKVLTADQKDQLRKLTIGEDTPKDKATPKDKSKDKGSE